MPAICRATVLPWHGPAPALGRGASSGRSKDRFYASWREDHSHASWQALCDVKLSGHEPCGGGELLRDKVSLKNFFALRLQRSSAYDAAYIGLAEQLGADLWTLDGPLARNATGVGYPVRLAE